MAITKPDWETKTQDDRDKEAEGVFEKPVLEEESLAIQELYSKLRESFDKTNEHITDVSNMKSDITTNNSKVGITTSQANAITANTKKIGMNLKGLTDIAFNFNKGSLTIVVSVGKDTYTTSFKLSKQ